MRVPELRSPLVVVALGLAAGVALATPSLPVAVRAGAAIALLFALPGTALALGVVPRVPLQRSERLAIAIGGSMTVAIVSAFGLHLAPSGLTAPAWAAILGGVTVAGGLLGWLRTRRRPSAVGGQEAVIGPWVSGPPDVTATRLALVSPWSIAMLAAAGVLVALSLVVARAGIALGPTAAFTELWLLPLDAGTAVRVGVANHEGDDETYRLVITVDGRPLGAPATLTVVDGGSTDAIVELPSARDPSHTVEVRLWRSDQGPTDPPDRYVRVEVGQDAATDP